MTMPAPLRIGVVGVGRIGALHAETLSRLDGVSVLLADADPIRAREVAASLGAPATPTPERLLAEGFDAIRYVTGEEIVEVYADGAVCETEWFARHDDVDVAAAVIRLSGSGLGIVSGARHDPLGYDVRLEVFGARESIVVGVDSRSPIRSVEPGMQRAGRGYRNFMERFERAYREELAVFVETVRSGGASACSLDDARAALSVALAADRSRRERRPVRIEEVGLARGAPEG